MDPGAFVLLGSVSFWAGVTRLTMSLTVIIVEITDDIHPTPTPTHYDNNHGGEMDR